MKLLDYIEATEFNKKSEAERAKLICYYEYKERGSLYYLITLQIVTLGAKSLTNYAVVLK